MPVESWAAVVGKAFPKVSSVTKLMVEAAARQSLLMRGSVRLMTGRLSTTEDLEERRRQAEKPLCE